MPEMTAAETAGEPIYDSLDDIIKALDAMYNSEKFIKKADYWSRCAGEAASILRRVASGELAPVIHAHWIGERGYLVHECSNCHKEFTEAEESDLEVLDFDYCPSCGALMDEKDDSHA